VSEKYKIILHILTRTKWEKQTTKHFASFACKKYPKLSGNLRLWRWKLWLLAKPATKLSSMN